MAYEYGYKASFGTGNQFLSGTRCVLVGSNNTGHTTDGFAAGQNNVVSGNHSSIALGSGNNALYAYTVALGKGNTSRG